METIKEMLTTNKRNLNLFHNERRLILLAVIKANYNLQKAFELNKPSYMEYSGYVKKFYRYGVTVSGLKSAVKELKTEKK